MWDARVFEAARVLRPTTRRECWVTHDRALGAVFLPLERNMRRPADPATPWAGWHTLKGDQPDYYQPLTPERWSVPLPDPIEFRSPEPQMWSATPRQPSFAPPPDEAGAPHGSDERGSEQWWRDPLAITYEPAGRISRKMAEGRVMRAVAWCGAGQGLTLRRRTPVDVLAAMAAEEEERAAGENRPRFVPLPQDRDDFDIAMAWYTQLNPPQTWGAKRYAWSLNPPQRVLLYRARPVPLSFVEIGWVLHRSAERARQLYHRAIDRCADLANVEAGPAAQALEEMRRRTRAARKGG